MDVSEVRTASILLKRRSTSTRLQDAESQKTVIFMLSPSSGLGEVFGTSANPFSHPISSLTLAPGQHNPATYKASFYWQSLIINKALKREETVAASRQNWLWGPVTFPRNQFMWHVMNVAMAYGSSYRVGVKWVTWTGSTCKLLPVYLFVVYLRLRFQQQRLYSVEWKGDKWIIKWKGFGRCGRGLIVNWYRKLWNSVLRSTANV
jgi:hypothetical protein